MDGHDNNRSLGGNSEPVNHFAGSYVDIDAYSLRTKGDPDAYSV